jgi:transposase-like protein
MIDRHTIRIVSALAEAQGNITRAARLLNINERTLRRWIDVDPELDAAHQRILSELAHTLPLTRTG